MNWRMVATGDYNGDGKVDIVWRHAVSGQNVIWFMDGINLISGTFTNPQHARRHQLEDRGAAVGGRAYPAAANVDAKLLALRVEVAASRPRLRAVSVTWPSHSGIDTGG